MHLASGYRMRTTIRAASPGAAPEHAIRMRKLAKSWRARPPGCCAVLLILHYEPGCNTSQRSLHCPTYDVRIAKTLAIAHAVRFWVWFGPFLPLLVILRASLIPELREGTVMTTFRRTSPFCLETFGRVKQLNYEEALKQNRGPGDVSNT